MTFKHRRVAPRSGWRGHGPLRLRAARCNRSRVVRVMCVVLAAITAVALPAAPALASSPPSIPLCQDATGVVYDVYGEPIAGATVTVNSSSCSSSPVTVSTDAAGRYRISVDATTSSQGYFAKAGYEGRYGFIAYNPTGGTANDATLRYTVQPTASPAWVQPGGTVTISATSVAPAPPSADGYVCEWGWSDVLGQERDHPAPVPGIGGTGVLSGAKAVAAGVDWDAALMADGTVAAWGVDAGGDLGDGARTDYFTRAAGRVVAVGGTGPLSGATQVAAGNYHGLALLGDGTVAAWGANWSGQLGMPTPDESPTPVLVPSPGGAGPLSGVLAVAAGGEQSLALLADGTVVRWGLVYSAAGGRLVAPELVRDAVGQVVQNVVAIEAGDQHAVALLSNGSVLSWGSNAAGQLGSPTTNGGTDAPVAVVGFNGTGVLGGVSKVSAGASHTVVLLADGTAAAWGDARYGQLGDGTASPAPGTVPRHVVAESGSGNAAGVAAVAATGWHSFALLGSGVALAWGENDSGQLGNDSRTNSAAPVRPDGGDGSGVLAGVTALAGDWANSVAVRTGPCDKPRAPTRLWLQAGSGSTATMTPMAPGATNSQGATTWTATITGSGADGTRTLKVCALDRSFTGTCDQGVAAAGVVSVAVPTTVSYGVDGTPPYVAWTTPGAYADVQGTSQVCATLADAGSGVSAASLTLKVDGALAAIGVSSGYYTQACVSPGAGFPGLGVHRVDIHGADVLGNATDKAFIFAFVNVTAGSAFASVPPMTVSVNPNNDVPPPETVTFQNVVADVQGFTESLSASTRVGYGTFARAVAFPGDVNSTYVTFEDALGNLSRPYAIPPVPAVQATHSAAVLAPTLQPVSTTIPPSTVALPAITIPVPLEQRFAAKAHLYIGQGELGAPYAPGGQPAQNSLPSPLPVLGTVTACLQWHPQGSTTAQCHEDSNSDYQVVIGQKQVSTFMPHPTRVPDEGTWGTMPSCSGCVDPTQPDASGQPGATSTYIGVPNAAALKLGCPSAVLGVPTNLCDGSGNSESSNGFLIARMNDAVYGDPASRFAIWRQDHVDADSAGDACPNGKSPVGQAGGQPGGVYGSIQRVVANTVPGDASTSPLIGGTYRAFDAAGADSPVIRLVDVSAGGAGPTEDTDNNTLSATSDLGPPQFAPDALGFSISVDHGAPRAATDGHYYVLSGQTVNPLGIPTVLPAAAANVWQLDQTQIPSRAADTGSVALVSTTLMRNPDPAGGFAYTAQLVFEGVVTYACG